MPIIDSHCHLTFTELSSQLDDAMQRAADAGVERMITIGTSLPDARNALEIASAYPDRVFCAVGFHPHEADKVGEEDLGLMAELLDHGKVCAFGEMGLDYHYDFADRDKQKQVLDAQLKIGEYRDLPIVIHSREAYDDTEQLLLDNGYEGRRVVFHCFTGTAEEAARIAQRGWRISFTGIVTFKNSTWLQEIAEAYPADQIMVETDAPYLSPVPVRNVRPNEPSFVKHTAAFLAELRGETFEAFAANATANTVSFFGL